MSHLKEKIRVFALENAIKFKGRANPGAVMGKILSEEPDARLNLKETQALATQVIQEVNSLSPEKQKEEFESSNKDYIKEKPKEERDVFSSLHISPPVVTGFPPGPEKYPHIGHAKALLLNYLLAKKHNGTFILRFEDTNPTLVQEQFYGIMQENFKWLGVKWDQLLYASDFMETYYQKAEQLIHSGDAYMCSCSGDQLKESRMKSIPCSCRDRSPEENLKLWKSFPGMKEGSYILRLKIDLKHKNSTMRDPTVFRIIDAPHPRHSSKYKIWPNYDFQNAIMDSMNGITIRLRSKEFEMRNELQRYIQEKLGLRITQTYEFARFNLVGVESSGRVIREKLEKGELIGWDDPTLTTLVALRRRGFLPKAIENFVISTGITKSESTLTWDDLIVHNKRLLDEQAKRFFLLIHPTKLHLENAPELDIELNLNPNTKEGGRPFHTTQNFLIEEKDIHQCREEELVRLMDCLNFRRHLHNLQFQSERYEDFKGKGKHIIHWLPDNNTNLSVEILMPDKTTIKGIAEHNLSSLTVGEVIQFERFGFCRLDSIEEKQGKKICKFWFTHS